MGETLNLPELLTSVAGTETTSASDWQNRRRQEVLDLFRTYIYGRAPVGKPTNLHFETVRTSDTAMSDKATLKILRIQYSGPSGQGAIDLTVYIPNDVPKPVPGFLYMSMAQKDIDSTQAIQSSLWPSENIIKRGYMTAAFHCSDLDPDFYDNFKNGVHGIYDPNDRPRPADAWGTIAAWGWGASRAMDYFESDKDIDEHKIGILGHSRCGKAALWCGAEDQRFALVVSNNSGCTGAAITRRKKGETVKIINDHFPHWFCDNYKRFNDREDQLPVDQHMLIALVAPRLVYVASASEDDWADPAGEFLSCVYAEPVYKLFGLTALGTSQMPLPNTPIHNGHIAYHLRTGKHDLTEYDWDCFMDYADSFLSHR